MTSQTVWIVISVGVFVGGIGVGYGIFINSQMNTYGHMGPDGFGMMSGTQIQQLTDDPQFRQQMMQDPEFRTEYANLMIQDSRHMDQMIQDPEFRNEMLRLMINDTDHMNQWLKEDPQHISIMVEEMKKNHDLMMEFVVPMIQDPGLRMQILGHMSENPDAMEEMRMMVNGTNPIETQMDQNMMNP